MTPNPMPRKNPGAAAPGVPSGKLKKPKKPGKPMPRFLVAALSVLLTLLLIAGAGAALYLNAAGLVQQVIQMLPQYGAAFEELDRRGKELDARAAELQVNQAKLEADAKANDRKAEDLAEREAKLAGDLQALQDAAADEESEAARKQKVVDIYMKMDASTAAEMLDKAATLQEVAAVLNDLSPDKAAEILAAMDPKKAYDVTRLMEK